MGRPGWKLAGLAGVALAAILAVTGLSLVPTSLALGPCLPDFTSPSTFRPRASPLASLDLPLSGGRARLCYGRPSARGRQVYGALVPYGEPWRLGANEPTRLYLQRRVRLGDLVLEPGRYSLYATPEPGRWTVHVTRSITHWGNDLSAAVRAADVGQVERSAEVLAEPVETLTIHAARQADSTMLLIDWATTRLSLPILPTGDHADE